MMEYHGWNIMDGQIYLRYIFKKLIGFSQHFSVSVNLSIAHSMRASARWNRSNLTRNLRDQRKPIEYVISILYKRPEFGENVKFLSAYYAKERRDARSIKRMLTKAFNLAHPSWVIKAVTVENYVAESGSKGRVGVQAIVPQEPVA